jgi:hypothetical protein
MLWLLPGPEKRGLFVWVYRQFYVQAETVGVNARSAGQHSLNHGPFDRFSGPLKGKNSSPPS